MRWTCKRGLGVLLAGLLLGTAMPAVPESIFVQPAVVSAADGRLYNQNEDYWKTVTFSQYSNSGNSMYSSGCGIFSFCNAIYALNGIQIRPENLGAWAVDNGSYRPGAGGLYRDLFYSEVEQAWGSQYHFSLNGQYYGNVLDSRLINHLKNGGVAVLHVPNHFIALTGYNAKNRTYHVIESAVFTGRGLAGDSWVDADKLMSGRTNGTWFALISDLTPPETASLTLNGSLFTARDTLKFTMNSNTRSNYTLTIDRANGSLYQKIQDTDSWRTDLRSYETSIPQEGDYVCYLTASNAHGSKQSQPIPFHVYSSRPKNAAVQPEQSSCRLGETLTFDVSGGTATSYTLMFYNENAKQMTTVRQNQLLTNNISRYSFTPQSPGTYTCQVVLANAYGSTSSETVSFRVSADMPVTFDAAGGVTQEPQKTVTYADTYGTLPIPERVGYIFDGWFTDAEAGTAVLEDTVVSQTAAHTLYAHWTAIEYLPGDITGDGITDISDAVLIHRLAENDPSYTVDDFAHLRADANGDGEITVDDVMVILYILS